MALLSGGAGTLRLYGLGREKEAAFFESERRRSRSQERAFDIRSRHTDALEVKTLNGGTVQCELKTGTRSRSRRAGFLREVRRLASGSCRLLFGDVLCLRALLALHDFELDVITLLQALVALRLDGAVVDEHVGTIVSADEAEALRVIEPFHFTFNSRHDPCSEPSWKNGRQNTSLPGLGI